MIRRCALLAAAAVGLSWWRRRNAPVSFRALANKEGINTWTAWRRGRLPARRDTGAGRV